MAEKAKHEVWGATAEQREKAVSSCLHKARNELLIMVSHAPAHDQDGYRAMIVSLNALIAQMENTPAWRYIEDEEE